METKLIDCPNFLEGECTPDCGFRHCNAAKKTTTVCEDWLDNACTLENCPQRHPRRRLKSKISTQVVLQDVAPVVAPSVVAQVDPSNERQLVPIQQAAVVQDLKLQIALMEERFKVAKVIDEMKTQAVTTALQNAHTVELLQAKFSEEANKNKIVTDYRDKLAEQEKDKQKLSAQHSEEKLKIQLEELKKQTQLELKLIEEKANNKVQVIHGSGPFYGSSVHIGRIPYSLSMSSRQGGYQNNYQSLIDDNHTTGCVTQCSSGQYIQANLPGHYFVKAVLIAAHTSWGSAHVNGVEFQISNDASSWSTRFTVGGVLDNNTQTQFGVQQSCHYCRLYSGSTRYIAVGSLVFFQ